MCQIGEKFMEIKNNPLFRDTQFKVFLVTATCFSAVCFLLDYWLLIPAAGMWILGISSRLLYGYRRN